MIEMTNSINGFSNWLDIAEREFINKKVCNSLKGEKKMQTEQKPYT